MCGSTDNPTFGLIPDDARKRPRHSILDKRLVVFVRRLVIRAASLFANEAVIPARRLKAEATANR